MTLVSADPLDFSCPSHNTDTVSRAGEEVTGEVYSWDACSDLCRNRHGHTDHPAMQIKLELQKIHRFSQSRRRPPSTRAFSWLKA